MTNEAVIRRGGGINPIWILLFAAALIGAIAVWVSSQRALNMCEFKPACNLPATTKLEDPGTGATGFYCDEHAARMVGWGWKLVGPAPD